jgi:hypothetical protein
LPPLLDGVSVTELFAGVVLAICVVYLARLMLGERRQRRFDFTVRRVYEACRRRALALYHWRSSRKRASRVADEVIRRARQDVERNGNVHTPKSFRGPRKPH